MSAVITAALPESEAGTALEAEAATEGVARRGAHAALASRNRDAYDFFMQLLPDGPYRRELQALDDDDQQRPRAEMIAAWTRLISDPADDAMTARCAAALARLGIWPPQADDLRARSILPEAEYEALKAVCRAEAGEPDLGIAQLRELSGDVRCSRPANWSTSWKGARRTRRGDQRGRAAGHPVAGTRRCRSSTSTCWAAHGRFQDAAAFIERAIPDHDAASRRPREAVRLVRDPPGQAGEPRRRGGHGTAGPGRRRRHRPGVAAGHRAVQRREPGRGPGSTGPVPAGARHRAGDAAVDAAAPGSRRSPPTRPGS